MSLGDWKRRLEESRPVVEEIQEICRVASVSVGVVHQNERIFTHEAGFRDVELGQRPTPRTIYAVASISKSIVVAALAVLVDEGKVSWTTPVSSVLNDFNPTGDPAISKEADFIDLLRHSAGLSNPVVSWLGPEGKVILKEDDFMKLVNQTPTGNKEQGQYFNKYWMYSNISYGVVAKAVEKLSGISYALFVKKRLFQPLKMETTVVSEADLSVVKNIALPHFRREDGSYAKLELEWTSEHFTSVLGALGVRSSVQDLLVWCAAIMQEEAGCSQEAPSGILKDISYNPLKLMHVVRQGYWTRPSLGTEDADCKAEYCLGWFRDVLPSTQLGWGSGNSDPSNDYVVGKDSQQRLMIKHTGLGVGITASVMTFPESRSAVVALCNGYNSCDAADFAAQVLTQALFDMKPLVDIPMRAKQELEKRQNKFQKMIMRDWWENRDVTLPQRKFSDFEGDYEGLAITLTIKRDEQGRPMLVFNGRADASVLLEYYSQDTYSFLPTSRDQWLCEGWLDWDYYKIGLLKFFRGNNGLVEGLFWRWEEESEAARFEKIRARKRKDAYSTNGYI